MRIPKPSALRSTVSGVEMGDDRLAERHRLEREDAVPAGVELVDDDVGPRVALARLVVADALDDVEVEPGAARRPRSRSGVPFFSRFEGAWTTSGLRVVGRRDRRELAEVEPGRDDARLGDPAERGVGADDLGACALAVRELARALAADVRAEVVEDALLARAPAGAGTAATSAPASARSRSGRCRSAAQPRKRRELRRRAVRGSGPCRSSDQSASGWSLPRLKTTSRASTPFRRSACTFSQGIPATFTGAACVSIAEPSSQPGDAVQAD